MRRTPYTKRGIRRVPCLRCGRPSSQQWQICSDGNQWRGVCTDCDVELNRMVAKFFGLAFDIDTYRARLEAAAAAGG